MPGQQSIVQLFDVPQSELDRQELIRMLRDIDSQIGQMKGFAIGGRNGTASMAELKKMELQYTESMTKIIALEKQLADLKKKTGSGPRDQETLKEQAAETLARQKNLASIKDEIRLNDAANTSTTQRLILLKQLRKQYLDLSEEQKKQPIGQQILAKIQPLDKQVKSDLADTGSHQLKVGDYIGAVSILGKSLTDVKNKMDALTNAGKSNGEEMQALKEQYQSLQALTSQQSKGFGSLTMEVRNGERALSTMYAAGLQSSEGYKQLSISVANAKRELNELAKNSQLLESESPGLQAMTLAAKGLAGAYALGAGAQALFADGDEKMQKELNKLVAIMTILQGLEEVHQLLERKGALATIAYNAAIALKNFLMTGSTKIKKESIAATEAETVAQGENIAVTEAGSLAMEENSVAAEANAVAMTETAVATEGAAVASRVATGAMVALRVALIATGIGAVLLLLPLLASGMSSASEKTKEDAKANKELAKTLADLEEAMQNFIARNDERYARDKNILENQLAQAEANRSSQEKLFAIKQKIADLDAKQATEKYDNTAFEARSISTHKQFTDEQILDESREKHLKKSNDATISLIMLNEELAKVQKKAIAQEAESANANAVAMSKAAVATGGAAVVATMAMAALSRAFTNTAEKVASLQEQIEAKKQLRDNEQKSAKDIIDIQKSLTNATNHQENSRLEFERYTEAEKRKVILESTKLEADLTTSKNELVLRDERSTLSQRLAAIKSSYIEQRKVIEAEKANVLNKRGISDADVKIAKKKAADDEIKAKEEVNKKLYDLNYEFVKRDREANMSVAKDILNDKLKADNEFLHEDKAQLEKSLTDINGYVEKRKAALAETYIVRRSLISEDQVNELANAAGNRKTPQEVLAINVKYAEQQQDLDRQYAKEKIDIERENIEISLKMWEKYYADRNAQITAAESIQIESLAHQYTAGLISTKEYNRQREQINFDAQEKILKNQLLDDFKIVESTKNGTAERTAANKKYAQDAIALADLEANHKKKLLEDNTEKALNLIHRIGFAWDEMYKTADDVAKVSFEKQLDRIQKTIEANNRLKETESRNIAASTLSVTQKAEMQMALDAKVAQQNEMLQNKEKQIKRQEAEWDKVNSIAQATINGAEAVTKTYADYGGGPWGIAAAIAVGALVAIQIGAIAATPIPAFATGTEGKPTSGPMVVGEKGREIIQAPTGETVISPSRPTLVYGEKGTKVITNKETENILQGTKSSADRTTRNDSKDSRSLIDKISHLSDKTVPFDRSSTEKSSTERSQSVSFFEKAKNIFYDRKSEKVVMSEKQGPKDPVQAAKINDLPVINLEAYAEGIGHLDFPVPPPISIHSDKSKIEKEKTISEKFRESMRPVAIEPKIFKTDELNKSIEMSIMRSMVEVIYEREAANMEHKIDQMRSEISDAIKQGTAAQIKAMKNIRQTVNIKDNSGFIEYKTSRQ